MENNRKAACDSQNQPILVCYTRRDNLFILSLYRI